MIAISSAMFGFVGYIGLTIYRGHSLGSGARGILALAMDGINAAIDMFGYHAVGIGIMVAALFCGIYAAIFIWRELPF
jgi:hypothetical protein